MKGADDLRGAFVGEARRTRCIMVPEAPASMKCALPIPIRKAAAPRPGFSFVLVWHQMQVGICVLVKSWPVGEILKRGDAKNAEEMRGPKFCVISASTFGARDHDANHYGGANEAAPWLAFSQCCVWTATNVEIRITSNKRMRRQRVVPCGVRSNVRGT